MSTFEPARIRCHCGHEQDVQLANGLHISARPDIRLQILEGTFHRFTCTACGDAIQIEKLLAYTDFPKRHWFTVVPHRDIDLRGERVAFAKRVFDQNMVRRAAPIMQELAPKMIQRVIFGLASLRDKMVCFDAGLDDRMIEALKLQLLRDLHLAADAASHFYLVEASGTDLVFEYAPASSDVTKLMTIPRGLLAELEHEREQIVNALPELWNDIVVDYRVILVPDASASAA